VKTTVNIMPASIGRPVEVRGPSYAINGKEQATSVRVGTFHTFTTDYEQLEGGVGQYPAAVVEFGDGTVEIFPVWRIKFLDRV
jgi:hypothetical protein